MILFFDFVQFHVRILRHLNIRVQAEQMAALVSLLAIEGLICRTKISFHHQDAYFQVNVARLSQDCHKIVT